MNRRTRPSHHLPAPVRAGRVGRAAVLLWVTCAFVLVAFVTGSASAALPSGTLCEKPLLTGVSGDSLAATTNWLGDNFQAADGDQCIPGNANDGGPTGTGTIDWHTLVPNYPLLTGASPLLDPMADNPVVTGTDYSTDPSVFGCSTTAPKELQPSGWCWAPAQIQNKSNIVTGYVDPQATPALDSTKPPGLFLRLGFARFGTTGSVNLSIELNKNQPTAGGPLNQVIPQRQGDGGVLNKNSDVLLSFDWTGGAPTITRCWWKGDANSGVWVGSDHTTACDNQAPSNDIVSGADAQAAVNDFDSHTDETISNFLPGGNFNSDINNNGNDYLKDGQFGEADVNLADILGVTPENPCVKFGSVFMHSRSSFSITSDPKDWVDPEPVNIANCGEVRIVKQTSPADSTQSFDFSSTDLPNSSGSTFSLIDHSSDPIADTDSSSVTKIYTDVLPTTGAGAVTSAYHVAEGALPSGWDFDHASCTDPVNSGANASHQVSGTRGVAITVDPGETIDCTFFNTQRGSISGHKYEDLNANGVKDSGEPAVQGVTIWTETNGVAGFQDTASGSTPADAHTTTDASGAWTLNGLAPATYTVKEVVPTGWTCSAGCSGFTVTLGAGESKTVDNSSASLDFLNYRKISISGTKYVDSNANGTIDSGEPVKSGVTIKLDPGTPNDTTDDSTTTTAADGTYSFTNLTPGITYTVSEDAPSGWTCSVPSPCNYSVPTTSGTNVTGKNFANWQPASISGHKYVDANANGTLSASETTGVSGVTIWIDSNGVSGFQDTASGSTPADIHTTTANDGSWTLSGVKPGTYTVKEVVPSGWFCSVGCSGFTVTVTSGQSKSTDDSSNALSFGNYQKISMSGTKYVDSNANGSIDSGEPVKSGVTIKLDPGTPNDTTDDSTTTTAADGTYSFTNLTPGITYTVSEVVPSGWTCSVPSPCNYSVPTTSGTNVTGKDFANWTPATISGHKYEDTNADGTLSQSETTGVGGVTIYTETNGVSGYQSTADGQTPADVAATQTANDGSWSLSGLKPGTYLIKEVVPSGWFCSVGCSGFTVTVTSGQSKSTDDSSNALSFGNYQKISISGTKYVDSNANGSMDSGEPVKSGVTIKLDPGTPANLADDSSTTTAADGTYSFTNLMPGITYRVYEDVPSGWTCSFPSTCDYSVPTTSGHNVTGKDFANWAPATISGHKYEDTNADGIKQAGETTPVAGVVIWTETNGVSGFQDTASGNTPADAHTTTDQNGAWSLSGLKPGTYLVKEVVPSGWTCSAGCSGFTVTVTSGQSKSVDDSSAALNFLNWQAGAISGAKFEDLNADGTRQSGEPAAQVDVFIDDNGAAGLQKTASGNIPADTWVHTDASGAWTISGLKPGTYHVQEDVPSGWFCSAGCSGFDVTVVSGVTSTQDNSQTPKALLFGNYRKLSISGTKYVDTNANGVIDSGEPVRAGVTIKLDPGTPANSADDLSTTTAADGTYSFTNLTPGITYRVYEVVESGWTCSYPATCQYSVPTTSGTNVTGKDFANWKPISISGTKYVDTNANGSIDSGEPVKSGVTIKLDPGTPNDTSDDSTTTTAADGSYSFTNLKPGITYTVSEVVPSGWTCSVPSPCNYSVPTTSGTNVTGKNFANWKPISISGTKYVDTNANGQIDPGEPVKSGVTIKLDPGTPLDSSDDVSTTTALDGSYSFINLKPGITYRVYEVVPSGWTCSYPATCQYSVPTTSGNDVIAKDFANYQAISISGTKYVDTNANGQIDSGEPVKSGVTIKLDPGTPNDPSDDLSTTTAANGTYSFTNLTPGITYLVYEVVPSGWICSVPATSCNYVVPTTSGNSASGKDFANYQNVSISGKKYVDTNANGQIDSGEPVKSGVTIKLDPGTPANSADDLSTTTAADGSYSFSGLTPGITYRVYEDVPSGWTCSYPATCQYSVPTSSGVDVTGKDFANWKPISISGTKYVDTNANGQIDSGEPVKSGVTIKLDPGTPNDSSDDSTTTTGADGSYSFTNLKPGITYTVSEVVPTGWTCSYPATCQYSVPTSSGVNVSGKDFANWKPISISGTKYVDTNANGQIDSGEPVKSGVTIKLDPGTPNDASDDLSTTTGNDGSYSFSGLQPGITYRVYEVVPSGWTCSYPASCDYSVPTSSGVDVTGKDFANYQAISISGTKYVDTNANGQIDSGEPVKSGVTIKLDPGTPNDSSDDQSTTTAADGSYSFTGLQPGITYRVYEDVPSGWTCSYPATCDYSVPTTSGNDVTGRNFANWKPISISGTKYVDTNANGQIDSGEPVKSGVTIKLDPGTPNDTSDDSTTTTAADGSYSFTGLQPGITYRVYEDVPSGWTCSYPATCDYSVPTTSGNNVSGKDFANWQPGSISGHKYVDENADGTLSQSETTGVGGVTMWIDSNGVQGFQDTASGNTPADIHTTTAADGTWTLSGVTPGTYTVNEVVPSGWHCSVGCSGFQVTVTSGSHETTSGETPLDFGNYQNAEITVVKTTEQEATRKFDFTTDLLQSEANTTGAFQLASGESRDFTELTPGVSHTTSELVPDGWALAKITCTSNLQDGTPTRVDIPSDLSASTTVRYTPNSGEHLTCTYDNSRQNVVLQVTKAVDKANAYDGDTLTYTIKVSHTAASIAPAKITSVNDVIQGTNHGCGTLSGPSGDTNNNNVLDLDETWTYTCSYKVVHSEENSNHDIVNQVTVSYTNLDGDQQPDAGPATATTHIWHPAIAIDKTGPATAQAGDKVSYVLTVTNPGDEPLKNVTVSDPQCNGDPVTLIGKNGDATPDTLDPGDVWTYSCSVQTAIGDTAIHNTATTTGTGNVVGGVVTANDSADTTLSQPAQIVLPERVTPGAARLVGPTGCVAKAFYARVRGTKIATVTFVLDGKVVKKIRNKKDAKLIKLRINPRKMKIGVHRLVVNITFQSSSGTKPKTLRLSFQRCAQKLAKPRFTG